MNCSKSSTNVGLRVTKLYSSQLKLSRKCFKFTKLWRINPKVQRQRRRRTPLIVGQHRCDRVHTIQTMKRRADINVHQPRLYLTTMRYCSRKSAWLGTNTCSSSLKVHGQAAGKKSMGSRWDKVLMHRPYAWCWFPKTLGYLSVIASLIQ